MIEMILIQILIHPFFVSLEKTHSSGCGPQAALNFSHIFIKLKKPKYFVSHSLVSLEAGLGNCLTAALCIMPLLHFLHLRTVNIRDEIN